MRMMPTAGMLAGFLLAATLQTPAHAQADFYKGKTVTIVVGARAVGSLSLSAQILARHMGQYIPGNPTVILRQMPGGAHLNATNYVFNVADPDGLTKSPAASSACCSGEVVFQRAGARLRPLPRRS